MKKLLMLGLAAILCIGMIGAAFAAFQDTESSTGNTFTAGSLDLKVNGVDAFVPYSVSNLKPGESRGTDTVSITNTGTLPGKLTFKVRNVVTNENDLVEPETTGGDAANLRIDPDGFSVGTGYGELFDQVYLVFWLDDQPGQRPSPSDWQDTKYWQGYPDESSYYSIPIDTDLLAGKVWASGTYAGQPIVLQPGQTAYMGIGVKFIDDTDTPYAWILDGAKNNVAMSDDFKFDIEIGLNQIP